MISAKQVKQILDYSLVTTTNFIAPIINLTVDVPLYTSNTVPNSLIFSGSISPNEAVNYSWSLFQGNVLLASGNTTTINYTLSTPPDTVGSYMYTLVLTFDAGTATGLVTTTTTQVLVTNPILIGQLESADVVITTAADLTSEIEDTLTSVTQSYVINLFSMILENTGKIVFVVPNNFGNVAMISDNTDINVTSEFTVVVDSVNSRKIWVSNLAFSPGTYFYKLVF